MYPLNRFSRTLSVSALTLAGILAVSANFAVAGGAMPSAKPLAPKPLAEELWAPSNNPAAVAAEMREVVRSETRERMKAALRPDSLVWNGALDGPKLAQEMSQDVNAPIPGNMLAGMKVAMSQIEIDLSADEKTREVKAQAPEAPQGPQRVAAWDYAQNPLVKPILP